MTAGSVCRVVAVKGRSWRLFRHLIGHDRTSFFRQLAAAEGARGGRRSLDSGNTHAAHGACTRPRLGTRRSPVGSFTILVISFRRRCDLSLIAPSGQTNL